MGTASSLDVRRIFTGDWVLQSAFYPAPRDSGAAAASRKELVPWRRNESTRSGQRNAVAVKWVAIRLITNSGTKIIVFVLRCS